MGISSNPLVPLRSGDMRPVEVGVPIATLAPVTRGILMCRVNGEWLLRECWLSETRDFDVIEWHDLPQDRDAVRGLLTIAAVLALGPYGLGLSGVELAIATFVAVTAINILLPPTTLTQNSPQKTSDAFSANLQGNEARLDQPIWKTCGRREITPPFACQPYYEYLPRDDAPDPNLDHDQYFYALYAVGVGNHDVLAKIANTPITRFADVLRAEYLPPGELPTVVRANVVTASEVSSQILDSGRYVGGFTACAAQRTVAAIGIDISATRGLGKGEDALTVEWRVEYRPINDFGQVLGPWKVLATESRTGYTATPQRWSDKYEMTTGSPALTPTAQRLEIRVVRTDLQDTSAGALHELAWIGLRAYLAEEAPLNQETAHFEVVMRASSQLSGLSTRDLRLLTKARCRTWDPDDGWGAEVHTRNAAWWMLDLLTSDTWGISKPDTRIDLPSFYELAQIADERQDRFDWTFDSSTNAWDALQLIARSVRARVFRRNGVISVARDQLETAPVTAFTPRNCLRNMAVSETMRTRNSPDGVCIEYQDHRTWEWTPIYCPCPGVAETVNPIRKRIEGITGATHAEREGRYEAANLIWRPRTASCVTEMEGALPAYMSPVDFLADIEGYGRSGDVTNWDSGSLIMELSEPPVFGADPLFITLIRPDGTCADPIAVSAGPSEFEVELESAPDFILLIDFGTQERTKYLIGPKDLAKVLAITDGGKTGDGAQLYRLTLVLDDDRVHEADVDLLPGPGVVQDPVFDPDDSDDTAGGGDGGGDILLLPRINDQYLEAATNDNGDTNALEARYQLRNNGTARAYLDDAGGAGYFNLASQWLLYGEVETSDAALFEVRAVQLIQVDSASDTTFTGTVGSWLSLDTNREWILRTEFTSGFDSRNAIWRLRIEIREVASGIIQDSATVELRTGVNVEVGGA